MARHKQYRGNITRRGKSWRIRLCVGGVYHSFTVGGTRVDAENAATDEHARLRGQVARVRAGRPGAVHFSTLLDEFSINELPQCAVGTQDSYELSMVYLRRYFVDYMERPDPLISAVTRADVKGFLEWRARQPKRGAPTQRVSAHTVARDLRVLSALFSYAIQKEYLEDSPTYKIRKPKGDKHTPIELTQEQLERMLARCATRPMLHLYVLLLAETGVRAYSEALQLRWEDIDFDAGLLRVVSAPTRRTKTGKSRTLPITERLREALIAHALRYRGAAYNGRTSPFVFHHEISRRAAVAGDRIRTMKDALKGALKAAELPQTMRIHDLRHRRVTTFLRDGHSPALVKEYMGHASIETTMGYMHLVAEDLRALVKTTAPAGPATPTEATVTDIREKMSVAS